MNAGVAGLAVGSEVAGCRIDAVAGEGGMGVVYVATQLRLNRRVALKVISPELAREANFRERFKRESLLAASIEHPNVIPVYEAGEKDGLLYLLMRYVGGTELRELLDREGALGSGRAARLMAQVAAAMAAAPRQGLVHRDIKPANVLVVSDPQDGREHAYLTDFGIARETAATGGITRTGAVVGTIDYLAPERFEGDRGDERTDVYAFGCMLYEVLAGEVPFQRDSDVAKMFAHANAPLPSLSEARPEVPPALVKVVERCTAKDPAERFADAGELARATAGAVTGAPPAPPEAAAVAEETVVSQPRREREHRPEAAPPEPPAPAPEPPVPAPEPPVPAPAPAPPAALPTADLGEKPRKRLPKGALVGLLAAVVAAVALILVLGGGGGGEKGGGGSATAATIPIRGGPDGLTVVGGKAWVASAAAGTLTPIDARSNEAGRAMKVGRDPDSVTAANGSVWVTNTGDGTVSRVDDSSGAPQGDEIDVGEKPEGITAGNGAVWVANSGEATLTAIDASSGRPRATASVGGSPIGVAAGPSSIWVTDTERDTVTRVDPGSASPRGAPIQVGSQPRGIAVSGGDVWVANSGDGTVSRIDESTGRPKGAPIRVGGGPREVAAAGTDGVWVTLSDAGQVVRLDPSGRVADRKRTGASPVGVAVAESGVWVASFGDDAVTRIRP